MRTQIVGTGLVAAMLISAWGCGASGTPGVHPVQGAVTKDGAAVEGVILEFYPAHGRSSTATTDAQGRYTAKFSREEDGAMLGTHEVKFFVPRVDPKTVNTSGMTAEDAETTRARAAEPQQLKYSEEIEVTASDNQIDFDLTGKK
ncbi:hypothetical protein C5Y96_22155 [Blastopirellula marina]|uniref:Carboxypeptidase regulatory-like domain-containing protein n=1 Tax=Blastopirellula marina TaxID=124 RepID=A0A2S8F1V1_9BACT|nr:MULTISPECIES: hypothetical protein [Pirellulaceae]PQO26152.1 hypothetical protein C5Y96_22155 [Blastopirellula marina]RCS44511.1 hypothetical protein DTL36_22200 [Bremerella cremea]